MFVHNMGLRLILINMSLTVTLLACFPGMRGDPGFFVVNSTFDEVDANPGNGTCATEAGECTLRAAIQESNAMPRGNTIRLRDSTYTLTIPEVSDGGIEGGDLDVTDALKIIGRGTSETIIDGNSNVVQRTSVFHIHVGLVLITDLTIQNGGGPTIMNAVARGGGIHISGGAVQLENVTVKDNKAFTGGGGIYNEDGVLVLENSMVTNNEANGAFGGGILNQPEGRLEIYGSTISNNTSNRCGGIYNFGFMTIRNSTISGNDVWDTSSAGTGGILNVGRANLNNVTIKDNTGRGVERGDAGGIFTYGSYAIFSFRNTIAAGNRNASFRGIADCSGTLSSGSYNLVQDTTGCTIVGDTTGNITRVDPMLLPLANYGGPTETHALSPSSPARNAGSPATPGSTVNSCMITDQRGVTRPQGLRCDIGAFELE